MNNFFKKNWPAILTYLLFVLGFIGFLAADEDIYVKYIMIALSALCLYCGIFKKNYEFIYYITLYFAEFSLYNFYEISNWPLWVIVGLALVILIFLSWQILANNNLAENKDKLIFITVLISFLNLEIFLTLLPWTTFARTKSLINLATFYALSGIIIISLKGQIKFKNIFPHLIISSILVILAISTTSWYAY